MSEQPSNKYPFVSVIIPVYNDLDHLRDLLASLAHQDYGSENFEVIVVDNGSDEDVSGVTQDFGVELLYENEIQSSYAARNKGIGGAKGAILAFIDSDCKADENWISEGIAMLTRTDASLVGGKVVFSFSRKKRAAEYYDAISNFQFAAKIARGTCGGGNLFVRKEVFDTVGLFPQNVKSGGDVFFSKKATENDFKLVYAPQAVVFHPTRTFCQLAVKTFRVAVGKGHISKMSAQKKRVKLVQSGSIWKLISPLELKRKLEKSEYKVSIAKFTAIVFVAYSILAVGFVGVLYSKLSKKG